jgi:hypothetical protein
MVSLAFWRDVSVVWLSLFCLVGLAIPLVVLYFSVRGLNFVHRQVAVLLQRSQGYSQIMRRQSEKLSHQVAAPVIRTQGRATRWRTVVQQLWRDRASRA